MSNVCPVKYLYSPYRRNYIMRNWQVILVTLVDGPNIGIEHFYHGLVPLQLLIQYM
jgi:hypothetical protein